MYQRADGLGFSLPKWLTPPQSVRSAVASIFGNVIKTANVSVPTPTGTVVFTGSSVPTLPAEPAPRDAGGVPGGWATVAVVAGLAALLLMRRGRR